MTPSPEGLMLWEWVTRGCSELFVAHVEKGSCSGVCVYTSPLRCANNAKSRNVFFGTERADLE